MKVIMTYQGIQQFNSGYISLYFTKVKILNKSIKERPKLDAVNLAIFRRIFKNHLKIYGNKHSKKYLIHFIKLKSKRGVYFGAHVVKVNHNFFVMALISLQISRQ